MSLMDALLETYNYALDKGLVDNPKLSTNGLTLLPIYHSNRVSGGEDIFEITLDSNSKAIDGRFLPKEEIIVFPITENSVKRTSAIAPHAISDDLTYLSKEVNSKKNREYIKGIKSLLDYEKEHNCENFRIIGEYVIKNTILQDFLKFHLGNIKYKIDDKFKLSYKELGDKGKVQKKSIDLTKIFITFKIEKKFSGDITLTRDKGIHDFYIDYVRNKNYHSNNLSYCDVTGKLEYCVTKHNSIIGKAKIISSNNEDIYYGRLKDEEDIYHISYEASQKIHNMLKYLIDNRNYSRCIWKEKKKGYETKAYIINWLSMDLDRGGIELFSDIEDDDFEYEEEKSMDMLGGEISHKLGKYFLGEKGEFNANRDFNILIIESVNKGRVAVKYFRNLSRSEAYQRVTDWYESTNWKFYNYKLKKFINKSPSLYQLTNFIYGQENSDGNLECKNKKLLRSTVERLIPSIIDSQKLPKDISKTTFYKLSNKLSYKKSWNTALNIGCSLIKKYKYDYKNLIIEANNIKEVKELEESRSFYYGKLMAIYEKIEIDATRGKLIDGELKGTKDAPIKTTNSDRLWSSMIRTPERTRFVLESKIKPYMNMLKKNNPGSYVFYDKLITEITLDLMNLKESNEQTKGSLNEDFILGYYYQKNMFYQKKSKNIEKDN